MFARKEYQKAVQVRADEITVEMQKADARALKAFIDKKEKAKSLKALKNKK